MEINKKNLVRGIQKKYIQTLAFYILKHYLSNLLRFFNNFFKPITFFAKTKTIFLFCKLIKHRLFNYFLVTFNFLLVFIWLEEENKINIFSLKTCLQIEIFIASMNSNLCSSLLNL